MTKQLLMNKAFKLRNQGYSYGYIQEKLQVSKSTLSLWLRSKKFTPNKLFYESVQKGRRNVSEYKKRIKAESIKSANQMSVSDIGIITKRDLYMLGLGLYLGEGSKTVCIRVVNSDPKIIKLVIRWFNKVYGIPYGNFAVRLHLYPNCNLKEAQDFWSNQIGVDQSQFQSPSIDKRPNKNIRNRGKLPFGTAHVTIKSRGNKNFGVLLMRRILNSLEIVKKEAGLV